MKRREITSRRLAFSTNICTALPHVSHRPMVSPRLHRHRPRPISTPPHRPLAQESPCLSVSGRRVMRGLASPGRAQTSRLASASEAICSAFWPRTSSTTTPRVPLSRWTATRLCRERLSHRRTAAWSPRPTSAASIIGTAAPPDERAFTNAREAAHALRASARKEIKAKRRRSHHPAVLDIQFRIRHLVAADYTRRHPLLTPQAPDGIFGTHNPVVQDQCQQSPPPAPFRRGCDSRDAQVCPRPEKRAFASPRTRAWTLFGGIRKGLGHLEFAFRNAQAR